MVSHLPVAAAFVLLTRLVLHGLVRGPRQDHGPDRTAGARTETRTAGHRSSLVVRSRSCVMPPSLETTKDHEDRSRTAAQDWSQTGQRPVLNWSLMTSNTIVGGAWRVGGWLARTDAPSQFKASIPSYYTVLRRVPEARCWFITRSQSVYVNTYNQRHSILWQRQRNATANVK